jgi:hypothetical protein
MSEMGGRGFVFSNATIYFSISATKPLFQTVDEEKIE